MSSVAILIDSIRQAKQRQEQWSRQSLEQRVHKLQELIPAILQHIDTALEIESGETGVTEKYLQEYSKPNIIKMLNQFLSDEWANDRFPTGVGAFVLPRVLVSEIFLGPVILAMALGNSVVVKASSETPKTIAFWKNFFDETEMSDIIYFVEGNRRDIGKLMFSHPGLDFIYFSGRSDSFENESFKFNKRYLGRMGSQNPAIILADADLTATSKQLAELCLQGGGRLPQSVSRILVDEKIFNDFKSEFKIQLEKFDFIEKLLAVDLAVVEGLLENQQFDMLFSSGASCKVIEDLTFCSELHQMDVQLPVVLVNPVKYAHEAVSWCGTNPYAYKVYLFTADLERAEKLSSKLNFSDIAVNSGFGLDPIVRPGLKLSGMGNFSYPDLKTFFSSPRILSYHRSSNQ